MRSIWTHAYKLGEIDSKTSPFFDHDLSAYRGEGSKQKQLFSHDQLSKVLKEASESVRDLVRLGLFTKARLSERCNAHEEIIEDVRCMVIKKGKTAAAARTIPIAKQIQDIQLPLGLDHKSAVLDESFLDSRPVRLQRTAALLPFPARAFRYRSATCKS